MNKTDPLSLDEFERLLADEPEITRQAEPARIPASSVPGLGSAVRVGDSPTAGGPDQLDADLMAVLHDFADTLDRGLRTSADFQKRLRLAERLRDSIDGLAAGLGGALSALRQPSSYMAAHYALENVAVTFFKCLGIPARTTDSLCESRGDKVLV